MALSGKNLATDLTLRKRLLHACLALTILNDRFSHGTACHTICMFWQNYIQNSVSLNYPETDWLYKRSGQWERSRTLETI